MDSLLFQLLDNIENIILLKQRTQIEQLNQYNQDLKRMYKKPELLVIELPHLFCKNPLSLRKRAEYQPPSP